MSFFKSFKGGVNEFPAEDEYEGEESFMEEEVVPAARMLSSSPYPQAKAETVISKGTIINGTLKGEGAVKIEGAIEGEVVFDGSVTVAISGRIKGPVTANIIRVFGNIEGSVTAKERLCLEKTGYIQGDIKTVSLIVDDGGQLNGRATMMGQPNQGPLADRARQDEASDLQFGQSYSVGAAPKVAGEEEVMEADTGEKDKTEALV